MPSPIAHVGAAFALLAGFAPRGGWVAQSPPNWVRLAFASAFASVAPDLDIVAAAVLPGGLDWHRGPTHSLLGAALIGVLVSMFSGVTGGRARALVVGAAVLHVPFDWSTGDPGAPVHYGVPWLWPFSNAKSIDPNPWFGAFRIDQSGFLANMWAPHALPVYGGELLTVVGLGALAWAGRRLYFAFRSTNS